MEMRGGKKKVETVSDDVFFLHLPLLGIEGSIMQ